jgi:hypothetical protein
MLKFSVQTFYQPLFRHSFPFNNFPLAILFLSVILFLSKSIPYPKAQSKGPKQKNKPKPKAKAKGKKQKTSSSPSEIFYKQRQAGWSRGSQGGVWHCNRRNLHSSFSESKFRRCSCSGLSVCGQGCAYLGLQMKAVKLHLDLLMSSSHRLFIIRSPHHPTAIRLDFYQLQDKNGKASA